MDESSDQWERDVLKELAFSALKEQRRSRRWSIFFKIVFFVWLIAFLLLLLPPSRADGPRKPHAALVNLTGPILPNTRASAAHIIKSLQKAYQDKATRGVILSINSPGGSPVQSAEIYDAIRYLRHKYPKIKTYAVCSDICASGAYYIASAADQIYANRASMIGSIGAIMNGFGFVDAIKKLGVERRVITSGQQKDFLDPFVPLRSADVEHAKKMLSDVHAIFIHDVREGRGDRLSSDPKLFSGLVWTGKEAKTLGLIDDFGTVNTVARDVIKEKRLRDYTVKPNALQRFFRKIGVDFASGITHGIMAALSTQTATF